MSLMHYFPLMQKAKNRILTFYRPGTPQSWENRYLIAL
jgi:hypothetical protein